MQAIILAAGMGRRLKDLTRDNTKCMIRVNDQTLIERVLFQLDSLNLGANFKMENRLINMHPTLYDYAISSTVGSL